MHMFSLPPTHLFRSTKLHCGSLNFGGGRVTGGLCGERIAPLQLCFDSGAGASQETAAQSVRMAPMMASEVAMVT